MDVIEKKVEEVSRGFLPMGITQNEGNKFNDLKQ